MKQIIKVLTVLAMVMTLTACATTARDGYNSQLGASLGAGLGAIGGQLVGGGGATLIGAAVGSIFGAIVGNGIDQEQLAAEDAVVRGRGRNDREVAGGYAGPATRRTDSRKGTDPTWEEPLMSGRVNETGAYDDAFENRYR